MRFMNLPHIESHPSAVPVFSFQYDVPLRVQNNVGAISIGRVDLQRSTASLSASVHEYITGFPIMKTLSRPLLQRRARTPTEIF